MPLATVGGSWWTARAAAVLLVTGVTLTLLALIPDTFFRTLTFAPPSVLALEFVQEAQAANQDPDATGQNLGPVTFSTGPFQFPQECQRQRCALLITGVRLAVKVALDDTTLATVGPFPRSVPNPGEFPGLVPLPTGVAADGSHRLHLTVLRQSAPAFSGRANLVLARHAASYVRANTVRLAFTPAASALGLVLIAVTVVINLVRSDRCRSYALVLIAHCLCTATAHYLFSDVACGRTDLSITASTILICRRLGDLTFFLLALWSLKFSGVVRRCAYAALGTFALFTTAYCGYLALLAGTSTDTLTFVAGATKLSKLTEWFKFAPLAMCFLGCLFSLRRKAFLLPCLLFAGLLLLTFCHEVSIFGFPYRSYLGKLHGLLVGGAFLAIYLRERAEMLAQRRIKSASGAAKAAQARQVAHDIRSPLAALRVLSQGENGLEASSRELLSASVDRLTAIAGLLLSQDAQAHDGPESAGQAVGGDSPFSVSRALSSLVAEKKLEYARLEQVCIALIVSPEAATSFCCSSIVDFQRAVSNLINNAVEAIRQLGEVEIHLSCDKSLVCVRITDDGCGIPEKLLRKLGHPGATFNKRGGNGLGLAHALDFADTNGGHIDVKSTCGSGTQIALSLPLAPTPAWFFENLSVREGQEVIIVDDDASIHSLWRHRMKALGLHERLRLRHVLYAHDLPTIEVKNSTLYLVDYHLQGFGCTGVELIKKWGVSANAVLTTDAADKAYIQGHCSTLGLRLLPKRGIVNLPIEVV